MEKRVRSSFHTQPEHVEPIIDSETGDVIAYNVHINASIQIENEECVIFIDITVVDWVYNVLLGRVIIVLDSSELYC